MIGREWFLCLMAVYMAGGWQMIRFAFPGEYFDETADVLARLIASAAFSAFMVFLNAKGVAYTFLGLFAAGALSLIKGRRKQKRRFVFGAFLAMLSVTAFFCFVRTN